MSETSVEARPVSPITQQLATYISTALRRPLPPAVLEKTKHHTLDTIAAMVSGSKLLPGRKAISYVKSRGGIEEAGVVATKIMTTAENAALANGMLAHADETDDSHAPSQTHPGCGVVSAALTMAQREGRNGTALLRAVALGYDVGTRLTMCLDALVFREDGHSTHSFGAMFGAAAAAGALARLNYTKTLHLLSFTAQQVSGVGAWVGDRDHIEKSFDFGGMPARNGVAAASMVAHGFTAADDSFSGTRNFFMAYGRNPKPEELVRGLGSDYEIMRTNIKRWSVGSPIQAPLDSLLELVRAHSVKAPDVESLRVRVSHTGARTVASDVMPDISMTQMCAVMLADGIVTFESAHDEPRLHDPAMVALRKRIVLEGDDELQKLLPVRAGIVELRLKDGRALTHRTDDVRGTAENPMTRAEVDEKAYLLMAPVLGKRRARSLCDTIWEIEGVSDIRELLPLLQA